MTWIFLIGIVTFIGLLVYWLLVSTEGVYLGRRAVVLMYDITAHKYDGIKQFDAIDERQAIARPLMVALKDKTHPLLLDVATGTARVPALLLNEPAFQGQVVGLDAAGKMLAQAQAKLAQLPDGRSQSAMLVQQTADRLPFDSERFDAVCCLEALEFFPDDRVALREIARVLKTGGFLMTSRRIGLEGKLFFGRYRPRSEFEAYLVDLGFAGVRSHVWLMNYNMVTAWKKAGN
jgi:ubiquinone/menaquinone biosynthesis C-methylase UbiE